MISPTMHILIVSCLNSGVGLYHGVFQDSGNDKVCPDALMHPDAVIKIAQMRFRIMRDMALCKIKCCLGLQIYHFYFVSDY